MYDLETLRYLNEQAYRRFLELANQENAPSEPLPEEPEEIKPIPKFPLAILSRKLLGGPPSLGYFIELIEMSDTFIRFRDMVREYLPDQEADIMAQDLDEQAQRFCQIFSNRYFPLSDFACSEEITLNDLIGEIPVQPMGAAYEAYHEFKNLRPGYIVMLSLVESPFDSGETYYDDEEPTGGGRIALLEEMQEIVGDELARLIPQEGWDAESLHRLTDGTKFEGIGHFADWLFSNTGCFHLDIQGEQLETGAGEQLEWDPETVDHLADDWETSRELLDKMHQVALLIEEDLKYTFRELMSILLHNPDLVIPKEQMPLPI